MLLDSLANFALSFSHAQNIVPIILIGYIWGKREIFHHALCILFTSILFNYALKVTFKIPLDPALNVIGYAFPSGHMHTSVAFYGWLMLNTRQSIYHTIIVLLLVFIGMSLIYFGYHNFIDILGAGFFASILLLGYSHFVKLNKFRQFIVIITLNTILLLYIYFVSEIISSIIIGYYGLTGLTISEYLLKKDLAPKSISQKTFTTIICILLVVVVKSIFTMKVMQSLPDYLKGLEWAFITSILPVSYFTSITYSNKEIRNVRS